MCEHAVGETRVRILLEEDGRDTARPACHDDGSRRVAADADQQVGPDLAEKSPGGDQARGQTQRRAGEPEEALATQGADGERPQRIATLGDHSRLDAARAADENDAGWPSSPERVGDREPWKEMTSRTTAGDDHS